MDETSLQVLEEDRKKAQSKSYLRIQYAGATRNHIHLWSFPQPTQVSKVRVSSNMPTSFPVILFKLPTSQIVGWAEALRKPSFDDFEAGFTNPAYELCSRAQFIRPITLR